MVRMPKGIFLNDKDIMSYKKTVFFGIVEDDKEYNSLLVGLLKQRKDIESVVPYFSSEELLKSSQLRSIDFLIVDIKLPGMDGINLLKEPAIKNRDIPKLILTGFNAEKKIFEALKYGATGYMFKEELNSLNVVVNTLLSGGAFISPNIAMHIIDYFQEISLTSSKIELLTKSEETILKLLTNGLSPKEIADKLDNETSTIRTHIRHIYSKLEINNYNQLIKITNSNPA
jgi:DNA-binding NarL/FixJ family response regulator